MKARLCSIVVTIVTLSAFAVHAQVPTGSIIGAITDESRGVLPGVTATITSDALPGGPQTGVSDAQGRYRFAGLTPGTYTLTLVLPGFANYEEQDLRVVTGGTIERNVSLALASVAETVTVTGESPVVDTRNSGVTSLSTQEAIESLPTIRGAATDYLQVLPGVVATNPGRSNERVQIMGSPIRETTYLHDGVMINHPARGDSFQGADLDSIEEIQMVALGASAEYALAGGGVVNVITKSGTNTHRGDATIWGYSDAWQSKPLKLNCRCPDGDTGYTLGRMRDMSAHMGGPIISDKLWYYGGYQFWQEQRTDPGNFPTDRPVNWWHRLPTRVTWQASDTLHISQLMHWEWYGGYGGPSRTIAREAATRWNEAHINSYATEVTKTVGNDTLLTFRVGGMWEPYLFAGPQFSDTFTPNHTDTLTGVQTQGGSRLLVEKFRRDTQMFKWERYLAGESVTHTFRSGVQFEQVSGERWNGLPGGVRFFDFGGEPDTARFQDPSVKGAAYDGAGVYAEDVMTLGNRTTITAGVRFDHLQAKSQDLEGVDQGLNQTGQTIPGLGNMFAWNLVSPRAGFNFKLTEDGRTVLRGTYGRSYRQMILREFDNLHPGITPVTVKRWDPATGDYSIIESVTLSGVNTDVNRNLTAPRQNTFSLGVDRELMSQLAVNVNYVFKKGTNLVGWDDIGGIYGEGTTVLSDGRTLRTRPLLNATSDRKFITTNRSDFSDVYHGFILGMNKRMSQRWQGLINLTLSKGEGLKDASNYGTLFGRDPNDLTNAFGRHVDTDLPVMLTAAGSYEIPVIDTQLSVNYQNLSSRTYAPVASVVLPQGRRSIKTEAPGENRPPRIVLLNLRINKLFRFPGNRSFEVIANIINLLQSESAVRFATFNEFSSNFLLPTRWIQPRYMYLGARVKF